MLAWTYWGAAEMYYEGWHEPWYAAPVYLIPGTVCLLLALAAFRWPRVGGWALIAVGTLFTLWWFRPRFEAGRLVVNRAWSNLLLSGTLVVIGGLFLLDARLRRERRTASEALPERHWLLRRPRVTIALGAYLLTVIGVSIYNLPRVLTRLDDGDRSARLIAGSGVTLVWAPEGPGWNYRQPWGGYPSWRSVALYGREPVGFEDKSQPLADEEDMAATNLCRYLSEDGLTLLDTPQDIWRMPTVDEIARSLVRDGKSAGCTWGGDLGRMECEVEPDKETPLWDPTAPPIYYWAFEAYDEREAYFVSYNGWVNATYQGGGNPRHSYRCVRDP